MVMPKISSTVMPAHGVSHVPDTLGARHGQLALEDAHASGLLRSLLVEAANADFQAAQGFLQGFLEGTADGHDFTHRLHLGGQAGVGLGNFSKAKRGSLVTT
jgi:hypothetical protein